MKRFLSKVSRHLGWNLVKNRESAVLRHHYAFQLNKLFRMTRPTMIIDVGGNRGQYFDFIQRFTDYRGPVVTFEPIPELYEFLSKKASGIPNWTIMPVALGAADTEMQLKVMRSDDFSSFLPPAESAGWIEQANQVKREITVPVKRLDGLLADITPDPCAERMFLKLDTQGFDLEVFAGAEGILPQVVALQSEVAMQPIYEGMPDIARSLEVFRNAGFGVTAFSKVADLDNVAVEFDCLMINRKTSG